MPLSTQAPFFTERGIGFSNSKFELRISKLLDSPISHNHLLGALVAPRLIAARRLSPGCNRIAAAGSFALAATVWMVDGIHRHAAYVRPDPAPARSARF